MTYTKSIVTQRFNDLLAAFESLLDIYGCHLTIWQPDHEFRYEAQFFFRNGYHFELYGTTREVAMQLRAVRETLSAVTGEEAKHE